MHAVHNSLHVSLIVPTFNERDNLIPLVQRVRQALSGHAYELIIVDDDSPDETWKLATEMAATDPHLRVIRRQQQRGLATAVVAGWNAARGALLGVMDGDLQYPPELLPELLKALDETGADVAIASRYVPGAKVEQWSFLRKLNSWGARLLARIALPGVLRRLRDPGAGCFVMRRQVIAEIALRPTGYKILLEVLARGRYANVVEVPHHYQGRQEGQSKLNFRQHLAYLSHLFRLARETGEFGRLLRWCAVGLSGVFVNLAVLWVLTDIYRTPYLYAATVAVACAMANNFLWHEGWTFADKIHTQRTLRHRLKRFLQFNALCAGGGLLNLGVLWLLTDGLGLNYLVSAIVGIGAAVVANYNLHVNSTWLRPKALQTRYAGGEHAATSARHYWRGFHRRKKASTGIG
jgi:dolichol-phosphate mannosyltransferase